MIQTEISLLECYARAAGAAVLVGLSIWLFWRLIAPRWLRSFGDRLPEYDHGRFDDQGEQCGKRQRERSRPPYS